MRSGGGYRPPFLLRQPFYTRAFNASLMAVVFVVYEYLDNLPRKITWGSAAEAE